MAAVLNKTKILTSDNIYYTHKKTWESILPYIEHLKDKKIWEAFHGGYSHIYLSELGFDVIQHKEDFFKNNRGDIVISNPPFSIKKDVLIRLKQLNKPFILILPALTLQSVYFRNLFKNDKDLQLIIPSKKLHFYKIINNEIVNKNRCCFYSVFVCWKVKLKKDIILI